MGTYVAYRSDGDVVRIAVGFWCTTVSSIMAFLMEAEALNVLQPFLVF